MEALNIEEFKNVLSYIIDNNIKLEVNNKKKTAIEVVGESGIGKTSAIIQLADEKKMHHVKLNLAQIEELGDLVGFPTKEFLISNVDTGEESWIQEDVLVPYLSDGYKLVKGQKPRMSYAPPAWLPENSDEGGIFILDDWNRGDQRFTQAIMELIDRGEYISWKLPQGWHIVLSANPDNGDYMVNSTDNAQKTRFISLDLEFDSKVWAKWAERAGIDGRCINFVLLHPEIMNQEGDVQTVNARSLVTFFNTIEGLGDFSTSENLAYIHMIASGCFSTKDNVVGNMFTMFINNKMDKLIQPEQMLKGTWAEVNKEIRDNVGRQSDGTYRADIASTLTIRFINYLLDGLEKKKIESKDIVDRVIDIVDNKDSKGKEEKDALLSMDLVFQLVKKLVATYPTAMQKMLSNHKLTNILLG